MCAKCEVCDFPCETLARSSYDGLPPGAGRAPEGKTHTCIYDYVFALGNVLSSRTIIYLHAYACTVCTLIHPGVHTRTYTRTHTHSRPQHAHKQAGRRASTAAGPRCFGPSAQHNNPSLCCSFKSQSPVVLQAEFLSFCDDLVVGTFYLSDLGTLLKARHAGNVTKRSCPSDETRGARCVFVKAVLRLVWSGSRVGFHFMFSLLNLYLLVYLLVFVFSLMLAFVLGWLYAPNLSQTFTQKVPALEEDLEGIGLIKLPREITTVAFFQELLKSSVAMPVSRPTLINDS